MSDITGVGPVRQQRVTEFSPKPRQAPAIPLPEAIQHKLEASMSEIYAVEAERDTLRKENSDLKTKLAATEAAMMMLESAKIASDSRATSCQIERDQAVTELGEFKGRHETVLEMIRKIVEPQSPQAE